MRVYTIGFAKKSAEKFFSLLRDSGAKRLLDIRLNSVAKTLRLAVIAGSSQEYLRDGWGELEIVHLR